MISRCSDARDRTRNRREWSSEATRTPRPEAIRERP
jgi:hypothetical protein